MINKLKQFFINAGRWIEDKWKHFKRWFIAGIIGASAIAAPLVVQDLTKNEVSLDKIQQKYEQSIEIKAKYKLDGSSLIRNEIKNAELDKYKNEPKDEIKITIGDNATASNGKKEFTPKIKMERWSEVSFSITPKDLNKVATRDKDLTFEGGKIKFTTPKIDYEMYEATNTEEGGYKYDKILNQKPDTNKIIFEIEVLNLDFFFQPPLNEEMKGQDCWTESCTATNCCDAYRPEEVVNSWAVYHSTKGGMVDVLGKAYGTGKAFHIFRPKATDANGNWIWIDLFIDTEAKTMIYTINQLWLDSAVYPVRF